MILQIQTLFKNLNIKRKLILAFSVAVSFVLAEFIVIILLTNQLVIGLNYINAINTSRDSVGECITVFETLAQPIKAVYDVKTLNENKQIFEKRFEIAKKSLDRTKFLLTTLSQDLVNDIQSVERNLNEMKNYANEYFSGQKHDLETNLEESKLLIEQVQSQSLEIFGSFKSHLDKLAHSEFQTLYSKRNLPIFTGIVLAILLIIFTILIAFLIIKQITTPIQNLINISEVVGGGNLNVKAEILSNDELGNLTRSFNDMIEALNKTIVSRDYFENIAEQNRLIIETSSDAFIAITENSKVINWNKQAEKTFGWLKEEAIGKDLSDLIMPEKYRESHRRGIAHFLKSGEGPVLNKRIEITAIRRNGDEFPVELTIWPIKQGDVYIFNSFMHDISERKQFEERMKYLVKREALGEFVAATAHEINNPIGIIAGNAKYLIEILKNEDGGSDKKLDLKEIIEGLESIYRNCIRCANTTKQLLAYSRESKLSLKSEMDLNNCISDVIDFVRNQFQQSKVFVETEFGRIPKINGSKEALEQAIINILLNSKQSMPDGGRLIIRTFKSGDGKVTCEIKDTGCGINEKDLEHVLEPFFTTKQEGTGLGLSVCYNIIKDHKGELKVESTVGKGTKVLIQLPGI
jgi:PAS domain S-box-containing protein